MGPAFKTRAAILAATLLAALPCAAQAQHQVNGDGHLLDNNLQVGSNGVNPPQAQPDYAARNDIITGNVTGLGYFHGRIPYRSPNEFNGRTSDDELFRFRAISWSSALPTIFPNLSPYSLGPTPVFRSFAPTTSGQVLSGASPEALRQPLDGSYNAYRVYTPTLVQQAEQKRALDAYGNTIGVISQPDGTQMQVTASPLLGVRSDILGPLPGTSKTEKTPQEIDKAKAAVSTGEASADSTTETPAEAPTATGAPAEKSKTMTPLQAPSIELGRQIRTMIQPLRSDAPQTPAPSSLDQVQAQMFAPLGGKQRFDVGEDPYLDRLAAVARPPAAGVEVQAPPAEMSIFNLPQLKPPTKEEAEKARIARIEASRRARGLPPLNYKPPSLQDIPPAEPQKNPEQERDVTGPLADLLDKLSYRGAPLKSLVGTQEGRFNQLMKQAESELVGGKYMAAEEHYRLALQAEKSNPLAIAGLIHAQLGAGMIRSAAFNLRALFEEHPELIATRYEPRLLPVGPRLEWARSQLDEMIRTTNRQEPALMLAYLGYQLNSPAIIAYGLDIADVRQPGDPLIALLRRIWLGTATASEENAPGNPPAGDAK